MGIVWFCLGSLWIYKGKRSNVEKPITNVKNIYAWIVVLLGMVISLISIIVVIVNLL